MKNKVLKVAIAIMLIIAMTMSDFILIGNSIVHALKNINDSTNHDNVKFVAYFKTEEGKEVSQLEHQINNNEMKLFMEVSVKNEGYFDGVITLEDSNFKLKQDRLGEGISQIDGNTITLNRVRAGNTAQIEVEIEPIIDESYDANMLGKESLLTLTGDYKDSTEKNISIEAEKKVALTFLAPNDIDTTLEGKVITNRIYKIGEENKRIVQIQLNLTVIDNAYPIKNTTFEVNLPEKVESVEAIAKGTYATNGEADRKLEQSNCTYDETNKLLKVSIENTNKDGKISWKKEAQDSIVVTLMLAESAEITGEEYSIKSKVQFQGKEEKALEKEIKYSLSEETKDGIIRASIENKEEIYKGKIYSREEREYNSTTNIEVNYANLINSSTFEEVAIYRTELEDKQANIEYKSTIIKKSEIEKILGTEGTIKIKDEEGKELARITKDTETDDNGNIVITYNSGIKVLNVEITRAVQTGIIRLNHTKVIKAEGYSKEEITALKNLVEKVKVKYNPTEETSVEYEFEKIKELKETKTAIELTTVPQTLSTAAVNEQVKIAVTLKTDSEQYDLYKNPTITIKLPEGIKSVSNIKTVSLYLDNFTLNTNYNQDTREIKIMLKGEQINYNGSNTNGYIEVLADIELDETIPSQRDTITLEYTNEKAVAYHNDGKTVAGVNISGYSGLVAFNSIINYNLKTNSVNSKQEQVGNLKMYNNAVEADFQVSLVNNTGTDLKGVKVVGSLPVEGNIALGKYTLENTIAATLKSNINIQNGNGIIYYTSNRNATIELEKTENGWNTNLEEVANPVLYMIVISNMEKETNFIANYTMNIPANLEYNKDMKATYVVDYSTDISNNTVHAVPVGLETGKVLVTLDATVGTDKLENDMTVKAGEVIRYKVTVTNTGSSEAKNVKISGLVPEGTTYVQPVDNYEHAAEVYYQEIEKIVAEMLVESLASKETKIFEYEVRVKKGVNQETIENQVTVIYGDSIEVKSNKLTNKLEDANIRVTIKRVAHLDTLMPGASGQYYVIVENISNEEQKNIQVKLNIPSEEVMTLKYVEELEKEKLETNAEWNIDNIPAEGYRVYNVFLKVSDIEASNIEANLSAILTQNGNTYRSNVYGEDLFGFEIEMKMTSPNEGEYLETNDTIVYEIVINNKSQIEVGMTFIDNISEQLTIQKVEIDGKVFEENILDNSIYEKLDIKANSSMTIKIFTIVNYDRTRLENKTITNMAKVLYGNQELAITENVSHIIESIVIKDEETENPEQPIDPEKPGQPENPENSENPEKPVDPEQPVEPEKPTNPEETIKKKYNLSGKAWVDQDKDGEINNQDTALGAIKVKLLNVETNEFVRNSETNKDLTVETNEEGHYEFENITEGKYIVVFEYDNTLYKPTAYQKEGIAESKNSNVVSKALTVNGEQKEYAATNEIELNQNIANINMGLVFVKQFDVELDKYISKVIVQTSNGSTTYDYQNEDFAKVDINAKRMVGSTVLVQYTIKVTNTGDVDAYVNSIIDYIPTGLKFSSDLNTQWYEVGTDLCTNILETTALAPGESREINLTLTKTKTDGNAELINNMAEIQDAYNIYGIADMNSTAGNKNKDENDLGSADLMISIQTGTVFNYIALVISMMGIIGASAYIIKRKVLRVRF